MTLAVSIKVNDGIVLAADSASTLINYGPAGQQVTNVYENGSKILHLHKAFPVGIITWGNGSIGSASNATLIKDFRHNISNEEEHIINEDNYSVQYITEKFFEFIKEKFNGFIPQDNRPLTGFRIAGYNINGEAEEWEIIFEGNRENVNKVSKNNDTGAFWRGQPEAMARLILGHSNMLPFLLNQVGIEQDKIEALLGLARNQLQASLVSPAMPIKDAIDLAEFFIDTTTKFVKFSPGAHQTVGGPIEIAAITKHEGFKWVQRKLYFDSTYNP